MAEKTGERRHEILQTVAQMLENPAGEKITTAALAKRLGVSEAALYRHFKGKAEMFEGLIEFIEQTLFALINRITGEEKSGVRQLEGIISVLLGFAQKNRGMTRVLIGDALVNEDERLQLRINHGSPQRSHPRRRRLGRCRARCEHRRQEREGKEQAGSSHRTSSGIISAGAGGTMSGCRRRRRATMRCTPTLSASKSTHSATAFT